VSMTDGSSYSFVHLDTIDPAVKPGASVSPGQFMGLSGGENPGYPGALHPATPQYSTGPHIDFDIWTAGAWQSTPLPNQAAQAIGSFRSGGIANGGPGNATGTDNQSSQAATIGIPSIGGSISNPLSGLNDLISRFTTPIGVIFSWIGQPLRIVKLAVGGTLIFLSLGIAFFPDIAAGATAAAGFPELALGVRAAVKGGTKRGVGSALQLGGAAAGRQPAANRQAVAQQRAQAYVAQRQQMQRAAPTVPSPSPALRAAPPTRNLQGGAPPTQQTPRAGRLGPLMRNTKNGPVPANTRNATPTSTPNSPIKSGQQGFGGYGFQQSGAEAAKAPLLRAQSGKLYIRKPGFLQPKNAVPTVESVTAKATPKGEAELAARRKAARERRDPESPSFALREGDTKRLDRNYRRRFLDNSRRAMRKLFGGS